MWFFYALAFAVISTGLVVVSKQLLKKTEEYTFLWLSDLFIVPLLFLAIISFYQVPKVDSVFLISIGIASIINVIAAILAYRAIKISEISLINPFSAFNPIFTTFIAYIFLDEMISNKGMVGILLIVVGAYFLQLGKFKSGLLAPVKALAKHRGVQLSIIAYFLWAITPIFQKTAIQHTFPETPPFAALAGGIGTFIIYTPIVFKFSKKPANYAMLNLKSFVFVGLLGTAGAIAAFTAFSLSNLGEVTAVFKLSMIFTVIAGWLFFKEKDIKERLLGSFVMLFGVIFLVT